MAPVEIGFIESVQYLLKRKAPKCLDKSACPQSCESPLKIHRHLVQLLAIMILIANTTEHTALSTTVVATGDKNKFGRCCQ